MRNLKSSIVLGSVLFAVGMLGCESKPVPVIKPGPPAPPPPVVVTPAPAAAPVPAAPMPVTLPPELIAKADELIKLLKPPAATGDALDQAAAIAEQQAKVVALSTELPAMVDKLSPEQKVEFNRRYQEQMTALMKSLTTPAAPATPPANP